MMYHVWSSRLPSANSVSYTQHCVRTLLECITVISLDCAKSLLVLGASETSCDEWVLHGEVCFKLNLDKLSFFLARNECLSNGGDLAMFPDSESLSSVIDFITEFNMSLPYVWFGLVRGRWKWQSGKNPIASFNWCFWPLHLRCLSSGHAFKYTKWQNDQPNSSKQNCAALNYDPNQGVGEWSDEDCTSTHSIICMDGQSASELLITE